MQIKFNISSSPHIRAPYDSSMIMWLVIISLLLPCLASVYFFGLNALILILTCSLTAVISEAAYQLLAKQKVSAFDGSAIITGILLALIIPPTLPLWMAAIGTAFSIIIVKCLFGGLGFNIFNPALAGRAFLLASWPVAMTSWVKPFDAVATATPLYLAKTYQSIPSYWDMFIGNRAGSLGETSALAIIIGAFILLLIRIIDWKIPATYIGTVFILTFMLGQDPIFYCLSGGLLLGAFYMATDYSTSPVTPKGRFIFGIGCGLITVLIRFFGSFPEGVNYAILLMNMVVPIIDRHSRPRVMGKGLKNV